MDSLRLHVFWSLECSAPFFTFQNFFKRFKSQKWIAGAKLNCANWVAHAKVFRFSVIHIIVMHSKPVYKTLNFWYGTNKTGSRTILIGLYLFTQLYYERLYAINQIHGTQFHVFDIILNLEWKLYIHMSEFEPKTVENAYFCID